MNIQPSVIIWTVICFLLLMVILKNLLFKPVLTILDKRKEKIASAEQKLRDIESISAENEYPFFVDPFCSVPKIIFENISCLIILPCKSYAIVKIWGTKAIKTITSINLTARFPAPFCFSL